MQTAERNNDLHTLYLAQLQLAQSLSWGNAREALSMAREALATYERKPDNERNYIIILDNIATYAAQLAYNEEGTFNEAMHYARKAYKLATASRDSTLMSQTLTSLANIYWALDSFSIALDCARRATDLAPPRLLSGAQQVLARCLVDCDSLSQAEALYARIDCGTDIKTVYIVQSNLTKLALQRNDTKDAMTAIEQAFAKAEELYFTALSQKDEYYQTALQHEQENERIRYYQKLQIALFVGGILLLILLLIGMMRELRLREREREAYRRENEARERETKEQNERLLQREATVRFLKNFIYRRSEIVRKLSANTDRLITLSEKEWSEVERMLNVIDDNRFSRMRELYPTLRKDDIRLCMLTRLQLSNRSIGNVYAISISAVQHRKLKLKKDIFGQTNPDISLEQVLEDI